MGSIPGLGRSPGRGHGNPLQYSCLENAMDRGAWWPTVHRVTKSWTRLKWLSMHTSPAFSNGGQVSKNWIIVGHINNFISNEENEKRDFCKIFSLRYTWLSALSTFVRQTNLSYIKYLYWTTWYIMCTRVLSHSGMSRSLTAACQTSLSMRFPRPENWSGLLFPSPGDL